MQLSGSLTQSVLQANLSHTSQPTDRAEAGAHDELYSRKYGKRTH